MEKTFSFSRHARLMGRFDMTDPERPVAGWVNSAVMARFRGTGLLLHVDGKQSSGDNWLEVVIDGIAINRLHVATERCTFIAADSLEDREHTIELHKRTGILKGLIYFTGLSVLGEGEFLPPPPPPDLRLEFFGDSITDGCGNAKPHMSPRSEASGDDGYRSYGAICARLLNADIHTQSVPGIGVRWSARGLPRALPDKFPYVFDANSPKWNHDGYQPHAVVVNLGTNDFSTPIDPALYEESYGNFLITLRKAYPNAAIVCCAGPTKNIYYPHIQNVVHQLTESGFENLHTFYLGLILPEVEGWGGHRHPSMLTHYRMGVDLAAFLSELLGRPLRCRPEAPRQELVLSQIRSIPPEAAGKGSSE